MSVTVYSRPRCTQCDATYRELDKNGVEYTVVDLFQDPSAFDKIESFGFSSAPVVVTNFDGEEDAWCGFRPDKIKKASEVLAAR